MDQDLSLVEQTEIARLRVTEPDNADQLVVDGISYGDRVGERLRRINPVGMADRNIGVRQKE